MSVLGASHSDCILVLLHMLLTLPHFVAIKSWGVTLLLGFPSFIV